MPREMILPDALGRHGVDIVVRIKSMVERAHENIVDVEQDSAVSLFSYRRNKFPLGHRRIGKRHVAGNVFDQYWSLERFLNLPNPRDDMTNRLFRVRQREQIVQIAPADAGPAEMVRDPRRFEATCKIAQSAE